MNNTNFDSNRAFFVEKIGVLVCNKTINGLHRGEKLLN